MLPPSQSPDGEEQQHQQQQRQDGGKQQLHQKARMMVDATAGAVAGCIARFLVGPLDVIKIRFQVQLEPIRPLDGSGDHSGGSARPGAPGGGAPSRPAAAAAPPGLSAAAGAASGAGRLRATPKYTGLFQALATIFKEEGVQGLWRGTVPGLLLTVPYTAVQFVAMQQLREAAASYGLTANPSLSAVVSFGSGALAGAAGTVASYPFDLLRTTMAAQGEPKVYHDMLDAARGIVRDKGFMGLYAGLGVTLIEIMPYAALQFGLYDGLQGVWRRAKEADVARRRRRQVEAGGDGAQQHGAPLWHDPRLSSFVCGLAAGLCAKLATHPLDVAKKRYQVAGLQRSLRYGARIQETFALQSLGASLMHIYRQEGLAGLWKGSVPSIVKAAPSAAITFTAYEAVLAALLLATTTTTATTPAAGTRAEDAPGAPTPASRRK